MSINDQHIDQLFRNRLSRDAVDPPPEIWQALEKDLPPDKKRSPILRKLWAKGVFYTVSAAAATSSTVYYYSNNEVSTNNNIIAQNFTLQQHSNTFVTAMPLIQQAVTQQTPAVIQGTAPAAFHLFTTAYNNEVAPGSAEADQQHHQHNIPTALTAQHEEETAPGGSSLLPAKTGSAQHRYTDDEAARAIAINEASAPREVPTLPEATADALPEPHSALPADGSNLRIEEPGQPTDTVGQEEENTAPNVANDTILPLFSDSTLHDSIIADVLLFEKENAASKLTITTFFEPLLMHYSVSKDREADDDLLDDYSYGQFESNAFSWTAGIDAGYDIANRWRLRTGLHYSKLAKWYDNDVEVLFYEEDDEVYGEETLEVLTAFGVHVLDMEDLPLPNEVDDEAMYDYHLLIKEQLHYLSIPLEVSYTIFRGKINWYATGGMQVNVSMKEQAEVNVDVPALGFNETLLYNSIEGLKQTYMAYKVGMGIECPISKKLSLTFEPNFKGSINSIHNHSPLPTQVQSFGFKTGLTFRNH